MPLVATALRALASPRVGISALATVIPFLPLPANEPRLAGLPDCSPAALRASVSLQGATGSQLGGLRLTNRGRKLCLLHGPLRLVLLDDRGRRLALARKSSRWPVGDVRVAPGGSAGAMLQLFNACDRRSTAHLWAVLARGQGRVDLGIGPAGRCNAPRSPPSYIVVGFIPDDTPTSAEEAAQRAGLRVVAIQLPARVSGGRLLRYTVVIRNRSTRPVPMKRCPRFYEQLWLWTREPGVVLTNEYTLNCRPLHGVFPAGKRIAFQMQIAVPERSSGTATLSWGLTIAPVYLDERVGTDEAIDHIVSPIPYSSADRWFTLGA